MGLELSNITISVQADDHSRFTPTSVHFDEKLERCVLELPQAIPSGAKARLGVSFEGELTEDLMGYYKSTSGEDNEDVYALTQFEVRFLIQMIIFVGFECNASAYCCSPCFPLLGRAVVKSDIQHIVDIAYGNCQLEQHACCV